MSKIAVILETLESHNHIVGDIPRGVKIYERGGIELMEQEPGYDGPEPTPPRLSAAGL